MRNLSLAIAIAGGLAVPSSDLPAQRKKFDPKEDSYTRNEPEALKHAGYVSFGPFGWGDDHNTENIAQRMGDIGLLWLETEHFRIGSTLPGWKMQLRDKKQNALYRGELEALAEKIPRLKPRNVRELDPWLRVHLFALRLEKLYEEFTKRMGTHLREAKPPESTAEGAMPDYAGMPRKFAVLLFAKRTDLERYLAVFLSMPGQRLPRRYIFPKSGSPLFVTAAEVEGNNLWDDRAMYCHVVFNVVHNLVDGYNGHFYPLPVWFAEGLAHWFARQVDEGYNNYSKAPELPADMKNYKDWDKITPMLLKHDNFAPATEVVKWLDYSNIKFRDHLAIWSRVDYLMSLKEDGLGIFLNAFKGRRDEKGATITGDAVFGVQLEGLKQAWDVDPETLDERWKAWAEGYYRRKR